MKCSRCGSAVNSIAKYCGLCRRPLDAPAGWEIPEHDERDLMPLEVAHVAACRCPECQE